MIEFHGFIFATNEAENVRVGVFFPGFITQGFGSLD